MTLTDEEREEWERKYMGAPAQPTPQPEREERSYGYHGEKHFRVCLRSGLGGPPMNAACGCEAIELKSRLAAAEQERDEMGKSVLSLSASLGKAIERNSELEQRAGDAEAALREIRDEQGKVCENYELCHHRSCASSYTAWVIADKVLNPSVYAAQARPAEPQEGGDGD